MTDRQIDIQAWTRSREALFAADMTVPDRINGYKQLISAMLEDLSVTVPKIFTSEFARNASVAHQYAFVPELRYAIQRIRMTNVPQIEEMQTDDWMILLDLVFECLSRIAEATEPVACVLPEPFATEWKQLQKEQTHPVRRMVLMEGMPGGNAIRVEDVATGLELEADIPDGTDLTGAPHVLSELLQKHIFPIEANALSVSFHGKKVRAVQWVIEPDYLVDVSTISESFKPEGTIPEMQIINRFKPRLATLHITLGNLVNYFLDEMIRHPDITFAELLGAVFRQQPLGLALLQDNAVREMVGKLEQHFKRLRFVLSSVLPTIGISARDALLEPSFFSERYGLQGRLDLLSHKDGKPVIVELKSGKPYRENAHGLSISHYVQTLLYDLLIRSAHDNRVEPENYILYSTVAEKNLRRAPRSRKLQQMALDVRNRYILLDRQLMMGPDLPSDWLETLLDPAHPSLQSGFVKKDHQEFLRMLGGLDTLERSYVYHFAGFLAREQHLSKTGALPQRQSRGMAALWLSELEDKMAQFDVLAYLHWERMDVSNDHPILVFSRTEKGNALSNFRTGDIGILYGDDGPQAALHQQLYRGSIIHLDDREVHFRLRSKQIQEADLLAFGSWHIEKDFLDSGILNNYSQIGQWMLLDKKKRQLLLGLRAPEFSSGESVEDYHPEGLNATQLGIFRRVIAAREYFLLWGPPGTGKTSVMLRELSRFWLSKTDDNLLLLAYTNRAVDEICESLESFGYTDYVRVGSRYSTGKAYREKLLEGQIRNIGRRDKLIDFLHKKRVFVSTVSSIIGKPELLHIKQFQTLVVDEASQITEPTMMGLPGRFDRFILIGDHRQLPAVVQQDPSLTAVKDESLYSIGLRSLSDSLFERLYLRAIDQGWNWAYDQLCHQGRMHKDLMHFPNEYFYQNSLRLMEDVPTVLSRQVASAASEGETDIWKRERLFYFNVPVDVSDPMGKSNDFEAKLVSEILKRLCLQYDELSGQEIGIITPYRSQIARINKELWDLGLSKEHITVDTVERFQGGARDVIILSLCLNNPRQLKTLVIRSLEGVDRKLNVALTRARERLIVLGNREIMAMDENYYALVKHLEAFGAVDAPFT